MAKKRGSPPPVKPRPTPAPDDQAARDRIEREFGKNFLVEAGAGSGKTRSLARRMAAGIAAGMYQVEHMAAVTFTRKAAAELRGRFQEALEDRLRGCPDKDGRPTCEPTPDERERLEEALRKIERLFAGTIHAFCAHLLRERPVEARVAPGFTELDEVDDARGRREAWREFVTRERAVGSPRILALQQAGLRPNDLDGAFAIVCQNEDVEFPVGDARMPDLETAWKALERFWKAFGPLVPRDPPPEPKCKVLPLALEFGGRFRWARRSKREAATLADFLTDWKRWTVTMTWWGANGRQAKELHERFKAEVAEPFVEQWRRYVYRVAVDVLTAARAFYAAERRRENVVNYVDLLLVTAELLRQNPAVRAALQQKYRWFFIDEFQDTDPIQAEIFLLLAEKGADLETGAGSTSSAGRTFRSAAPDIRSANLETVPVPGSAAGGRLPLAGSLIPGSLFVVGDPKQSIYRFRRADIDIYNRVRDLIVASGGEVLHLTANWRSLPGVCALANAVFPGQFPAQATRESPAFEPLDPRRAEADAPDGPRIARLVVPADLNKKDVAAWEADAIARYVKAEVGRGARKYGSFLVLTRYRPRLAEYADAFDRYQVPVEVSGAGRFGGSAQVAALASLLASLADPLDGAALVGVLRGPFFGFSDPELYAYRAAGGRFEIIAPLLGDDGDRLVEAERDPERAASLAAYLDERYGPVVSALVRLRAWRLLARRLPLGAAVERVLEESGWLAAAAASPGGAKAGDLLQAVDTVRQVAERGGGLDEAADALSEDEEVSAELEALPLEPGKRDVVRLMNLHKAKGLEAEVVFLADPVHGRGFGIDVRIVRDASEMETGAVSSASGPETLPVPIPGGSTSASVGRTFRSAAPGFRSAAPASRPLGYLEIARKKEGQFWRTVLAEPAGWDDHKRIEEGYREAEITRLLYVAATRARDRLVVGQWAHVDSKGKTQDEAWGVFDDFLASVPELSVPARTGTGEMRTGSVSSVSIPGTVPVPVSDAPVPHLIAARASAIAARASRHADVRVASWQVASVTGEHVPIRTRASRVRDAMGEDMGTGSVSSVSIPDTVPVPPADPLATDTPTDRVDAGAAWGSLVHGLLEHAMRRRTATRDDLARLAKWLTVEHDELRPSIPLALDTVEAVMRSDFWREPSSASELHVEVPFAVLVETTAGGEMGAGSRDMGTGSVSSASVAETVPVPMSPTVLRGVVDLVYRAPDGWRIVDYKTDRVEGGVAELLERHRAQLAAYVDAWRTATGGTPTRTGIFGIRNVEVGWTPR